MIKCGCGQVEIHFEGSRIILNAAPEAGAVIMEAIKGTDTLRVEHLACQSCQRITLEPDDTAG